MASHDPIAYAYDAAFHCPDCTLARFGRADDGFIAGQSADGSYPTDSEGNPVGVLAPWDEWQQFDGERETLACDTCGAILDTYTPDDWNEWDEETTLNRFDLYGALWAFASRWHSGQASRGYRILSRLSRAEYTPGLGLQQGRFESEAQADIYRALLKYRKEV